ncbi:hypothetical protein [Mesorhizobium metallidurans]|uniref:hypothetical protein n=1 Tax=Mesorhizobium metallidurans TaxID=489722 RepID=UPI0003474622|nr:hypothetical protein [Mesorhizobium metallidurans]
MTQRRVDKEKFERADREAKVALETERRHREAKTARLREQRLAAGMVNSSPERSYSPKLSS